MIVECPECEGNPVRLSVDCYGNETWSYCPACDGEREIEIEDPEEMEKAA